MMGAARVRRRRLAGAAAQRGWGLAAWLLAGFALVLTAAAITAWVVAGVIGPRVFHQHLVAAGLSGDHPAMAHAEQAFRSASGTSLALALAVAAMAAGVLSAAMTRRAGRSLRELAEAAERIAAGEFDSRVAPPRLVSEFEALAASFNDMAQALAASQALRDRLLADVAHELRTPLATITGYLEAIEDGLAPASPETFALLRQQADRLTRLAQDLVAVTRAEQGGGALEREPVAVADLLDAAAAAARPAFHGKGVTVSVEPAPAAMVEVDRARLAQVLTNLLDNALRHTPPGGRVSLAARWAADDGGIHPAAGPDPSGVHPVDCAGAESARARLLSGEPGAGNRTVLIEVTDSGEGIALEHLPHIFDRFYRADLARDRLHGGSGIGLAIARAFVQAHGGWIVADSAGPGGGATFTVALPTLDSVDSAHP